MFSLKLILACQGRSFFLLVQREGPFFITSLFRKGIFKMKSILVIIALFFCSMACSVANASVIDNGLEFKIAGIGVSYNNMGSQIEAPWRRATLAEMILMVNNKGFPAAGGQIVRGPDISQLVNDLGITGTLSDREYSWGMTVSGLDDSRAVAFVNMFDEAAEDIVVGNWDVGKTSENADIGTFLVREVVTGTISGYTMDANHIPISGVVVKFWKDGTKTETMSDINGWFLFADLLDGQYGIVGIAPGYEKMKIYTKLKQSAKWGVSASVNFLFE